jgi:hypothetical protein
MNVQHSRTRGALNPVNAAVSQGLETAGMRQCFTIAVHVDLPIDGATVIDPI